jgi:hypothetical protein
MAIQAVQVVNCVAHSEPGAQIEQQMGIAQWAGEIEQRNPFVRKLR